jgi:hypothetical protein
MLEKQQTVWRILPVYMVMHAYLIPYWLHEQQVIVSSKKVLTIHPTHFQPEA